MKSSFTLIEILIVIIILGIITSVISLNFILSIKKGRDAKRKADLNQIKTALELYYEDKKAYPTKNPLPETYGFVFGGEFIDSSNNKVYMKVIPNDPIFGRNYYYDSDGSYFKLYACLENDQQTLPYQSNPSSFICNTRCKNKENNTIPCIFGISSPNVSP